MFRLTPPTVLVTDAGKIEPTMHFLFHVKELINKGSPDTNDWFWHITNVRAPIYS